MFYQYYTLQKVILKIDNTKEEVEEKSEADEERKSDEEDEERQSEEEEDPVKDRSYNPYKDFLNTIGEGEEEEAQGAGLMGGLKSWLGFAGSMTGTGERSHMSLAKCEQSGVKCEQSATEKASVQSRIISVFHSVKIRLGLKFIFV